MQAKPNTVEGAKDTALDTGKVILSGFGGSAIGAMAGKYSLLFAIPLTAFGVHKGNDYMIAAGLGMAVGSNYKSQGAVNGLEGAEDIYGLEGGLEGFSLKDFMNGAKTRLSNWMSHNKAKLPLKASMKGIGDTSYMDGFGDTYSDMAAIGETDYMNGMGNSDDMGTVEEIPMGTVRQPVENGQIMVGLSSLGNVL